MDLDLAPQHATFRAAVRELAQGVALPHAAEVDLEHRFPDEAIEAAAAAGLLGVLIPREYGGAGLDAIAFAVCIEELAQACASTSVIVDVHKSVGSEPILLFGTEEQEYIEPAIAQLRGEGWHVSGPVSPDTVFLRAAARLRLGTRRQRNNRSMPIVAETEQIPDRRNSPLNSRAQISDGSAKRFFIMRGKVFLCWIKALRPIKTIEWE